MAQKQQDGRQPSGKASSASDEPGFKPVALPALRAAMNAAAPKPPRSKSHHDSPWMLHEHALLG